MSRYLAARDIKFVVVLIPLKYQVDNQLKEDFAKSNYKDQDYDLDQAKDIIKKWALENGVKVIDLGPGLSKKNINNDFFWKFNPHFNVKGNEEVAKIIHSELNLSGFNQ